MPASFAAEAHLPIEVALLKIARYAASIIFRPDSIRLMRVIQAEALHHPEIVQIYYDVGPRRVKNAFRDLLQDFDRQNQIAIADPARAAEQFFSLLKGEVLQRTLMFQQPPLQAEEFEKHIQTTVSFFLSAYRSTPVQKTETDKS
jgi:TetR/AcrR family transcriptional repressor of mexJK operon